MRSAILTFGIFIWTSIIFGQITGTSFELNEPVPSNETKDWRASDFIKMTFNIVTPPGSNFSATSDVNNYVRASIDPFYVEPPGGGETGGPIPGDNGVVGTIPGSLSVSGSGSAVYSIPIEVSPGVSGMTPEISLVYNSNGGDGVMGPGWTLGGVSAVSSVRQTEYYSGTQVNFDFQSYFNAKEYSLDGQKLIQIGVTTGYQTAEYRTEDESFSRVQKNAWNDGWFFTSSTKSGLYYEYGYSIDSRQRSSAATLFPERAVMNYFVDKIKDRLGNEIIFNYTNIPLSGECYIASIVYGNCKVLFEYTDRESDIITRVQHHGSNNTFKVTKRLTTIKSLFNGTVYRTYNLHYSSRGTTENSYFDWLELVGTDQMKFNKTVFTWPDIPTEDYNFNCSEELTGNGKPFVGDFNGDGLNDICFQKAMGPNGPNVHDESNEVVIMRNHGGGNFSATPSISNHPNHKYQQVHVADFNGDGISDILLTVIEDINSHFIGDLYLFNKDFGFTLYPQAIIYNGSYNGYRADVGDFDGDGLADILIRLYNGEVSTCKYGTADVANPFETRSNGISWPFFAVENNIVFADFNGNGRTDLLQINPTGDSYLYKNNLTDWDAVISTIPEGLFNFDIEDDFLLGDFNGDMVTDVCLIKDNQDFSIFQCWGAGFVRTLDNKNIPIPNCVADANYFVGDFNGDSRSDILRSRYCTLNYEMQADFTIVLSNSAGDDLIEVSTHQYGGTNTKYAISCIGDFDSDGRSDLFGNIFYVDDPVPTNRYIKYQGGRLYLLDAPIDKVYAITNGLGITERIEYKPYFGSIRTDGTIPTFPIAFLPGQLFVVNQISSNGESYIKSTTYRFESPRVHMQGKGFLGFLQTVSRAYQSSNSDLTELTTYQIDDDFFFIAPIYNKKYISKLVGNPVPISETFNLYDKHKYWDQNKWSLKYFPYLKKTLSKVYENDGSLVKVSRTDYGYNTWGDLTSSHSMQDNDPYLNLNSNESDFEFREINTNTYYSPDETNWILGRLENAYVLQQKNGSDDITHASYFEYYTDGPFKGMLKKEHQQPWDAQKLSKEYFYKDTAPGKGNLIKTIQRGTDMEDREYHTVYDNQGRFIESSFDPLDHSDYKEYDPFTGKITLLKDPNGLAMKYMYDNLGRLLKTTNPDGTQSVSVLRWGIEGDDDAPTEPVMANYYSWAKTSGGSVSKTYYDKFGRELRIVAIGLNDQKIYVDKEYYDNNLLKKVSDPYFKGSAASGILYTEYTYDDINRLKTQISPGNRIMSTTYNGLETTITNPELQQNTKILNAAGWLIESIDANGNSNTYEYYSNGLLYRINDPKNNKTEITYDLFGNRTKLHDPDLGLISYTYNPFGELLNKTDANNKYTTYQYDKLGRMIYSNEPEGETFWTYDIAQNGIGKIAEVRSPNVIQTYNYDELSRPVSTVETFGGESFTTSNTYDVIGRSKTLVYPSGYEVRNVYDNNGYLVKIQQNDNGKMLWETRDINARGQLIEFAMGNGLSTYHGYDENTGLITSIATPNIQDIEYAWYNIANLKYRYDRSKSIKEEFLYDDVNRLESVIRNGVQTLSMSYDELGNITKKSDVGDYSYEGPRPHAVTAINGNNMPISLLLQEIQYTSFDKIKHIDEGENSLDIIYGASHERKMMKEYKEGNITKQKYYVGGGLYEKVIENGSEKQVHYLNGGSGLFAIYTINKMTGIEESKGKNVTEYDFKYIHTDHLGSIQCITDENGILIEEYSYDAWGKRRNPLTWEAFVEPPRLIMDRGFTGHEHLDLFELVNMNGRIYDPVIGRFLSADPFSQMPEHTQGLNRYSYCMNNPLSFTDPSGYSMSDAGFASFISTMVGFVVMAGITVASLGTAAPLMVAVLAGAAARFTGGVLNALMSGANFSQALGAGMMEGTKGAFISAATNCIGSMWANSAKFIHLAIRSAAHGVFYGGLNLIQGGRFELGLISGFFSSIGLGSMTKYLGDNTLAYGVVGAAIGGTAEALGGGKFANGAVTGAFIGLFNDAMHQVQTEIKHVKSMSGKWDWKELNDDLRAQVIIDNLKEWDYTRDPELSDFFTNSPKSPSININGANVVIDGKSMKVWISMRTAAPIVSAMAYHSNPPGLFGYPSDVYFAKIAWGSVLYMYSYESNGSLLYNYIDNR